MVLTSREERVLIAIKTRRKYSECVRVRVSGGSYKQAGKVSHMELQKAIKTFVEKEPSGHSSYGFPGTATLGL